MKKQIYAIAIAFLFVHIAYSQFSTREYQFDNKFLKPIKFKTYKEKPLFIYATDRIGRYWKVLIPIEVENVNKSRFERFHFSNYINSVDYRKIQYNIDFLNDYSALDDETIRRYLFGMMNDQGKKNFFTNNKGEKSFEYWGGSNTTTEQQKEIFKKFTKSGIHQEIIKLYNKLLNENPYIKFKAVIRPLKDEGKVEVIIDEISARSGRDTNLGVYVTFKYPEENEVIRNLDTYNYLMNGGLDLKKPNSRKYLPYMYIIRTLKQPYKGTVFFDSNYQDKGKDFGQKDLYVNEYKYVESSIGIGDFKKWMADYDIDCEDLFNKTEDCEKQIEYIYNYYLKKEIFVPSLPC